MAASRALLLGLPVMVNHGCGSQEGVFVAFRIVTAVDPHAPDRDPFDPSNSDTVRVRLEHRGLAVMPIGVASDDCVKPHCEEFPSSATSFGLGPFKGSLLGHSLRVEVFKDGELRATGRSFPFDVNDGVATIAPHVLVIPEGLYALPVGRQPLGAQVQGMIATQDGALIATAEGALWRYQAHGAVTGAALLTEALPADPALQGATWTALVPQPRDDVRIREAYLLAVHPDPHSDAALARAYDQDARQVGPPVTLPATHARGAALVALPSGRSAVVVGGMPDQRSVGLAGPVAALAAAATVTRLELHGQELTTQPLGRLRWPLSDATGVGLWVDPETVPGAEPVERVVLVGGYTGTRADILPGLPASERMSPYLVSFDPSPHPGARTDPREQPLQQQWVNLTELQVPPDPHFRGLLAPAVVSPSRAHVLVAGGQKRIDCFFSEGRYLDRRRQPCEKFASRLWLFELGRDRLEERATGIEPSTIEPARAGAAVVKLDRDIVLVAGGFGLSGSSQTAEVVDLVGGWNPATVAIPVEMSQPQGAILLDRTVLLADEQGIVVHADRRL
ncbi:MAG: hypothetical protein MJD61_06095 [Proteobacteria bacterium]|nr:hypothetical protein [Pseudomonadota bacterium]